MVECTNEELILLALAGRGDEEGTDPVPVEDLSAALDVREGSMSERVRLLSSLSSLVGDGLVAERTLPGVGAERTGYVLTEAGRTRTDAVRERVRDATVEVVSGDGVETVPLDSAGDYEGIGSPVDALAQMSEDGIVRVGDEPADQFVNRRSELDAVRGLLDPVEDGQFRTLLVTGSPGIGKTTFLSEAADLARERGATVYTATVSGDSDRPYVPFRRALSGAIEDHGLSDPFEGVAGSGDDADGFEARRNELFHSVVAAVEAAGAETPVAFVFDDLHDADDATLALFESVVEGVEGPVLLVGAYRPTEIAGGVGPGSLDGSDRVARVDLDPFDREDTRRLVEYHVGSREVPGHLVDVVYERTGGTPLFVAESVERMLDDGSVDPRRGIYPDAPEAVPVPDRVEAAIDDRLDVLDDAGRDVLEAAAVAGKSPSVALLDAVCPVPAVRISEYVELLVEGRVLDRSDEGVRFASDVVRETVLDRIEEDRRRSLHERVAEALMDRPEGEVPAATVATHLESAGDIDRAAEWYSTAGDRAMETYAHEVAVENYRRALSLARDRGHDRTVQELLLSLGRTNYLRSEYAEAERYFEYVRDRADGDRYVAASQYLAAIHNERGEYDAALELVADGLDRWDGETPTEAVCDLFTRRSWAQRLSGRLDEAAESARRQHDLATRLGDSFRVGGAYHLLALVEFDRGNFEETLAYTEAAVDRYEAADRPWRVARALTNEGMVHARRGDLDAAREVYERALEVQRDVGDESGVATGLLNLGFVESRAGNYGTAIDYFERAVSKAAAVEAEPTERVAAANVGVLQFKRGDVAAARGRLEDAVGRFDETGDDRSRSNFRAFLSAVLLAAGRVEAARSAAAAALSTAQAASIRAESARARRQLAAVLRATGEISTAVDHGEAAVATATELGSDPQLSCSTRTELARTYLGADRPGEALETAREAVEDAGDAPDPWWSLRASATLGVCLRATGQREAAQRHLRSALETARDCGARLEEARVLYELGQLHRDRGATDPATEAFEEVRAVAVDLGASLLEERVRGALDVDPGDG